MKPLHLLVLLLALTLSACATTQNNHDPIEPVNRVTDSVNDAIDRVTLKPLAEGYSAAVPKPMRTAVTNFYDNATYMNTVLNGFLQGKGAQGSQDFLRFLINTIFGIGGLVDVATSMGLERHDEDFGQTLATWGVSQGAYVVYPLLGPNSLRNTPDFITSTATNPLFWAGLVVAPYVTIPITALNYVDKRAQLLEASTMRDELALDPYVFTREAWKQNREFNIHDGHPPAPAVNEEDDWEEDDWEEDDDFGESENGTGTNLSDSETVADDLNPGMKTRITIASAPPADVLLDQPGLTASANEGEVDIIDRPQGDTDPDNAATANLPESGIYNIYISSHYSEAEAAAEQAGFAKQNIHTTIVPSTIKQHTWHRLRISKHNNRKEALAQLKTIRSNPGLEKAWIEVDTK